MIPIDKKLSSIKGIDSALLAQLEKQGIRTVEDLHKQTGQPHERQDLAKVVGRSKEEVNSWAKNADLMRIEEIDAAIAEPLINSGVRSIEDLADADIFTLKQILDNSLEEKKRPSLDKISLWQKEARSLDKSYINDIDDLPKAFITKNLKGYRGDLYKKINSQSENSTKLVEGSFFNDLSELMSEIGRGIAEAQHELDMSSMEIQKYIDSDDNLSNLGLSARWYVMPESTFQMKVNYTVVREETEDGRKTGLKRIRVAPFNAKYQNYFKSTSNTESNLTFKIVPIPAPAALNETILIPNLVGLTLGEAEQVISESRLRLGQLLEVEEPIEKEQLTQIISQSRAAGTEARVNDIISLTYTKQTDDD